MSLFDIATVEQLAKHLRVHPLEIRDVLSRRREFYRTFKKWKPDGSFRVLHDPQGALRLLQGKVKSHILDHVGLPDCVHGGVRYRSVVTNALPHVGKEIVFSVDIRNFYPSIRSCVVRSIFLALGFAGESADLLTDITTLNNEVPQGVATSTALANLAMQRVDVRLLSLSKQQNFAYTRWIDDLTISGARRLLDFRRLIQRIIVEEGFALRTDKIKTMHSGERQVVTGIVVNRKLNIFREDRIQLRRKVIQLRLRKKSAASSLDRVRGQISWLTQVNPALGNRLAKRLPQ